MSFRSMILVSAFGTLGALGALVACGPTARETTDCNGAQVDTTSDPHNCGTCGSACAQNEGCTNSVCGAESCSPGDSRMCYDGGDGTEGVGACHGGSQTCPSSGTWGDCIGEVVPVQEICGNGIDDDCNGMVDEDVDADGDGYTTCGGDCCDNTNLCGNPAQVNPGAYDVPGDGVDNDCDGMVDDDPAPCDSGLNSNSATGTDYAKAIELCKSASTADPMKRWGVFSATLTQVNGDGTSANPPTALKSAQSVQHSIRKAYGTGTTPKAGSSLVLLSTGNAAGASDTNPPPDEEEDAELGVTCAYPSDFASAHGGTIPNLTGCPAAGSIPDVTNKLANDPIMLTLTIRVPTNANSFTLETNFFSSEYPEWVCSPYNDFFVVLLDSTYAGTPANPTDKNLAFYASPGGTQYPVGVNLAYNSTGLFTQCVSGTTGCEDGATAGSNTSCTSTSELAGTGMDGSDGGACDDNSLIGGGTGWLETTGNVVPGETITLRIALWDTSDDALDSLAVIDAFEWNADAGTPGTIIPDKNPHLGNRPGAFPLHYAITAQGKPEAVSRIAQ